MRLAARLRCLRCSFLRLLSQVRARCWRRRAANRAVRCPSVRSRSAAVRSSGFALADLRARISAALSESRLARVRATTSGDAVPPRLSMPRRARTARWKGAGSVYVVSTRGATHHRAVPMGWRGRSASPARLVRLTCQRKHRCMMSCCGSWYGSQGLLLACRLPAALSTAGHAPSSPPRSTPMACHRRLRDRRLRAGRRHLAALVETWAS